MIYASELDKSHLKSSKYSIFNDLDKINDTKYLPAAFFSKNGTTESFISASIF